MSRKFIILIAAVAFTLLVSDGQACNVPVFRYALERWPADLYDCTVFHRGELTADQRAVVKALQNASDDGLVNLQVAVVDVGGEMRADVDKLWNEQGNPELPLVVVQYPAITQFEQLIGKGALSAAFAQQLLDSPARRAVRQRILQGESVVWVVLESGDKARDDAVAKLLETESKRLEELLELPPIDPMDPRTDVNVTLKIGFTIVRLSRTDPAERLFVSQLLNIHPRFAESKGPLVYPVFGRGRALCGLTEDELTQVNVEDIAMFLTGACSCEVKAMNPGVDLLVAADWDALVEGRAVQEPELPPLVSLSQMVAQTQSTQTLTAVAEPATPQSPPNALVRNMIVVIGVGLIVIVGGTILLRAKGRK